MSSPAFDILARAVRPDTVRRYLELEALAHDNLRKAEEVSTKEKENPFSEVADLTEWKIAVQNFENLVVLIKDAEAKKDSLVRAYSDWTNTDLKLSELEEFYTQALAQVTDRFLRKQEYALTEAYRYIYQKDKSVKLSMEEYRGGRVIKLSLLDRDAEGNIFEEDLDEEGHSVNVVMGSILLIYFIITYGLPRIVFFDESFSGHADEALNRLMSLLGQFRDGAGFDFVFISHDKHRMLPFADRVYEVSDGNYSLVVDAV